MWNQLLMFWRRGFAVYSFYSEIENSGFVWDESMSATVWSYSQFLFAGDTEWKAAKSVPPEYEEITCFQLLVSLIDKSLVIGKIL